MYLNLKDYWLSKDEIIRFEHIEENQKLHNELVWHIQKMYMLSWEYMKNKNNDWDYLDNQERNTISDGKIKPNFTFQMKKAYIAQYINEWLYPLYEWVKSLWDRDVAKKLNQLAKYDIDIMRKPIKDKEMLEDVFDYGVSVVIKEYFNMYTATPEVKIVTPKYWYPDPSGNTLDNNFRRHFFSTITTKWEIEQANSKSKNMWWEEVYCWIDDLVAWPSYNDQLKYRNDKSLRSLNVSWYNDDIYILQWYITLNWHKYVVSLGNAHNKIIRFEPIEAISKQEKKDPTTVEFPIAIYNAFPLKNDPCGVSYRELLFDKDNALKRLSNAIYRKELRNAWFDNILVDIDQIPNINVLAHKTDDWPNYIPFSWSNANDQPLTRQMTEFNDTTSSMNFYQYMVSMSEQDTGIDQLMRWQADQNSTLWQAEYQQQKSNILFSLDAMMLSVWESMFWKNIYLRSLMENIKEVKEKSAILTTMNGMDSIVKLERWELIWSNSPFVRVKSKKQQIEEAKTQLAHLEAFYAMELQDPNVSPLVVKIYKRTMRSLQWFDEDFIYATVRTDVYEDRAIWLMNIINSSVKVPEGYQLLQPWLDIKQQLEALRYYVWMCVSCPEKDKYMRIISKYVMQEWIQVQQQQVEGIQWIANSMWSQMVSNKINNFTSKPWM